MENIGRNLKALREAKGFTPTELAKASRVSKSYISELESGAREKISLRIASKLARALSITVDGFLHGTPVPVSKETVRIDDPEIRLFFSGDWDALDDSEKDWIRRAIKIAKERQQGGQDANGHGKGSSGKVQGDETRGGS